MLAIVVRGALVGPPGTAAAMIIERAEAGEWTDTVDHARFAGTAFTPPSVEEIEHWRDVVFGRDAVS